MKKLLSIMGIIAASAMTANAQIESIPVQNSDFFPQPFVDAIVTNTSEYAFYSKGPQYYSPNSYLYIYNGNLELVREIKIPAKSMRFAYLSKSFLDDYLYLTQTIFNNDEKFEFICCKDGFTGFHLINEDEEILQSIDFPKGFVMKQAEECRGILDLGDKKFLFFIVSTGNDDNTHYYQLYYRINKGGGSGVFTLACDPIKVEASPRMASKSEPITVTFDSDAVTRVEVVSVRGAVEEAFDVEAGAHSAIVDTSRLGKGMYIINVVADGVRSENCKVIIR